MSTTTMRPEPAQQGEDQPSRQVTDPARQPVLVAGEGVDAISVPADFAALVQAELEIMMLAGPVATERSGSWIFVTEPASSPPPAVPADLLPLGVRLVLASTPLPVPTCLASRPPAIWSAVIGAARRVAHCCARAGTR